MFSFNPTRILALAAVVLSACSGSGGSTTTPVTPVLTSISISAPASTIAVNGTVQLTASTKDQNGSAISATVAWSSSASGVASVSSSGLVTGVGAGVATITGASGSVSGTTAIAVVTSFPAVANVASSGNTWVPASVDISVGGTVNWTTQGVTHNVTMNAVAGAPANIANFNSSTQSRTFTTAGTFPYQCTIHSGMTATVVVH